MERAAKEAEEKRLAEEKAVQEEAAKAIAQSQADTAQNNTPAPEPVNPPQNSAATPNPSDSGNGSNFNTYDNAAQQQTNASYVLNTNSHKIHYPTCRSVPKIAPQNYATSNSSVDELIAQGYSTCGNCFK